LSNYYIKGGNVLSGKIDVSGAKNAALPILAASVMTEGENLFSSCPSISDVQSMLKILAALGCKVHRAADTVSVDASQMNCCRIPDDMMKEMRSSVFLAGSLLTRCGEAVISHPGGCNIGERPIDIHIDGLTKLGAHIEYTTENIVIKAGNLKGADIKLAYPSVGATENLMLAAMGAEGTTRIINSAREPEIEDLQNYINSCGGNVRGAGSGIIEVEGRKRLTGCSYRIMPDRIEAGTYLLMALASGGDIVLEGISKKPIASLINVLAKCGYELRCRESSVSVKTCGTHRVSTHITTAPYPGFPTDLQPQMTAFLAVKGSDCSVCETIFEKRFEYAKQLKKMGADIEIFEKQVIIKDNNILYGARLEAQDLRGGAALIIAGLAAEGSTVVENTKYVKRGYSRLEEKIRLLGGEITEDED